MTTKEGHRLEAWTLLSNDYNPHTVNTAQAYLRNILGFKHANQQTEVSAKLNELGGGGGRAPLRGTLRRGFGLRDKAGQIVRHPTA